MAVPALVVRAPGTNCDAETAFALERAGASPTILHLMRLVEEPSHLDRAKILVIPGGFSFGDDLAAGRVFAARLARHLGERLRQFADQGGLILGICNGFQVLLKTGLLEPAAVAVGSSTAEPSATDDSTPRPAATLTWNTSGRYVDRWVHLQVDPDHSCVFLEGIDRLELPIAHAEGRFVVRDQETLTALDEAGQLVLRYVGPEPPGSGIEGAVPISDAASDASFAGVPANPNGSVRDVAGLCDPTGRIFGLMPHPERYLDRLHHPRWTRGEGRDPGDGLQLFVNAVAACS